MIFYRAKLFFISAVFLGVFSQQAAAACFCWDCVIRGQEFYQVMASGMSPTIEAGDCVKARRVNGEEAQPTAGDIISFIRSEAEADWISRIVATEGDTVQMIDGGLWLNGVAVEVAQISDFEKPFQPEGPYDNFPRCAEPVAIGEICRAMRFIETLPNGRAYEILDLGSGRFDDTELFVVPAGHVFVLSDNRDNAIDSRVSRSLPISGPGFVPLGRIVGILEGL